MCRGSLKRSESRLHDCDGRRKGFTAAKEFRSGNQKQPILSIFYMMILIFPRMHWMKGNQPSAANKKVGKLSSITGLQRQGWEKEGGGGPPSFFVFLKRIPSLKRILARLHMYCGCRMTSRITSTAVISGGK